MGIFDFNSGKKITTSRDRGKPPLFGNYGYQKHAKSTRIKDSVVFNKKVRDVHWDKLMQKTGKANFKTRSGEIIGKRESKKIITDMIKKAGYRGLSGQQIKNKLVREHGMRYSDAGTIARVATYHYYEPEIVGPTWKEIKEQEKMERKRRERNVLEAVIGREREEGAVDTFHDRRNAKNIIKSSMEGEDSSRLNIKQREYKVVSAKEGVSTGDFRGRKTPRVSASGQANAAAVAGGYGAKVPDKLGNVGRKLGGVAPLGFKKGIK